MGYEKRKNNPHKIFTARYDPVTGEIQGLIPGSYNADSSVIATPEIVSDPRQWRYDFTLKQMVKKPQVEIDTILKSRLEGKLTFARGKNILNEMDNVLQKLDSIEQRLTLIEQQLPKTGL